MRSARRLAPVDDNGGQIKAGLDGIEGVEDRLLVFLQVAVVGQWQSLDQNHEGRAARR